MKKQDKKAAFTLVEIMIVVAIIGLLAAIGIPSFNKARANSIAKTKANNVRLVNNAIDEWAMDNAAATGTIVAQSDIEPYIKGGMAGLKVGTLDATFPAAAAVDTELVTADLYP